MLFSSYLISGKMAKLMMNHFGSQEPNFSGFEVVGAGLPRTGTSSLRMALCQLVIHFDLEKAFSNKVG